MFDTIIRYVILAILFLLGSAIIMMFSYFLEQKIRLSETVCAYIDGVLILVFIAALIGAWFYFGPDYIREEKMAIQSITYEEQVKIDVKDPLKEKGKEPVYRVECPYGTFEIPESTYLDYIGDENNAVTIHFETTTLYVSCSAFIHDFNESRMFSITRLSPPWESAPKAFTDEETREFINLLLDKKDKLEKSDFSFDIDHYSTGSAFRNCLEDGAVRIHSD